MSHPIPGISSPKDGQPLMPASWSRRIDGMRRSAVENIQASARMLIGAKLASDKAIARMPVATTPMNMHST